MIAGTLGVNSARGFKLVGQFAKRNRVGITSERSEHLTLHFLPNLSLPTLHFIQFFVIKVYDFHLSTIQEFPLNL